MRVTAARETGGRGALRWRCADKAPAASSRLGLSVLLLLEHLMKLNYMQKQAALRC